jgi:hypothetical protein
VAKDGGEEVLLLSEGTGASRRFTATQVSFNGKSVFVAVVAREGIWFEMDLHAAKKDSTLVVEGWRPTFRAKWMTLLAKRPAVGATSGIVSDTLPLPLLPPGGDTPYSDVYVRPHVPSWFTGPQWRLYLESSLTHMMTRKKVVSPEFLLAINYPRDRVKQTPLSALTLVDVMRDTLGTGSCEYILDLEGLNKTRSTGAAGTGKPTAAGTCSEHGALVFYYLGERSETPRRDDPLIVTDEALSSIEKIKDFLNAAHARIQECMSWSDEIIRVAEEAKASNPQTRDLADRIIRIAREMREMWQAMADHDKPCVHPEEGCLVWIGAIGLVVLVAAGLIYLLGTPLNRTLFPLLAGPLLGMLGVGGVLCLYALIACLLGFVHWGRVFRRFRRDEAPEIQAVLKDGIVAVKTVSATSVIELEETSDYIFDVGDGRGLLRKGRRYFPIADDMPWPNSDFEIGRSVDGKVWVGFSVLVRPLSLSGQSRYRIVRTKSRSRIANRSFWDERTTFWRIS